MYSLLKSFYRLLLPGASYLVDQYKMLEQFTPGLSREACSDAFKAEVRLRANGSSVELLLDCLLLVKLACPSKFAWSLIAFTVAWLWDCLLLVKLDSLSIEICLESHGSSVELLWGCLLLVKLDSLSIEVCLESHGFTVAWLWDFLLLVKLDSLSIEICL